MTHDIEVIWDNTSAIYASLNGTIYDCEKHRIVDHSHWIDVLRHQLNNPDLFLYHHLVSAKFVLASWVFYPEEGKGPGLMIELETMTGHPDHDAQVPDLPHIDYLRRRCCPSEEMKDRMAYKVRRIVGERKEKVREEGEARADYAKHLARQFPNNPDIAQSIRYGCPWTPKEQVSNADWEKYVELAKKL